jgi:AraC family transcriptional regulator
MDWQIKMNQALNYIEENIEGDICFDTIAKITNCTVWEFQRIFSFVAHTSLGEYIRRRKLALAANDIQTTSEKIIDTSLRYGYSSPEAFARAFKRHYGISPSSLRNGDVKLPPYPKITFPPTQGEGAEHNIKPNNELQTYRERGYYVDENAPPYYTHDINKTCAWFRDVLGWYGGVVGMNSDGDADYGCVYDYPGELNAVGLTPFRGFHVFKGEPYKGVVGFIFVQGLERLHEFVLSNGWNQISEIKKQPWGNTECCVTTIDGCILRFLE